MHSIGTNGMASKMKSESGELIMEFKASKKPIAALSFSIGKVINIVLLLTSFSCWTQSLSHLILFIVF